MDMRIDAACCQDFSFAGDDLGAGADHDIDAGLDVGIAGLADPRDAAIPDRQIRLDDAPVIDDQRVGDDRIGRAFGLGRLRLSHAVADHLAAAELDLFAVDRQVAFDFDEQLGIGEPDPVADRRAEHLGIEPARHASHQSSAPITAPSKALHDAPAAIRNQGDLAALTRLEAHRGSGRDIEPLTAPAARSNERAALVSAKW